MPKAGRNPDYSMPSGPRDPVRNASCPRREPSRQSASPVAEYPVTDNVSPTRPPLPSKAPAPCCGSALPWPVPQPGSRCANTRRQASSHLPESEASFPEVLFRAHHIACREPRRSLAGAARQRSNGRRCNRAIAEGYLPRRNDCEIRKWHRSAGSSYKASFQVPQDQIVPYSLLLTTGQLPRADARVAPLQSNRRSNHTCSFRS